MLPAAMLLALLASMPAQSAFPALGGDQPVEHIPENNDIRGQLWDTLLTVPPARIGPTPAMIRSNAWASWRIQLDRTKDALYISLMPSRHDRYSQYVQGTWIIKRSLASGAFMQAKIFMRSDPGTFIRIYPFGQRSRLDVVAYGGVLYREVILPLPFETVLRSPLSRIRTLTKDVVDWSIFSPDPALYTQTRLLARAIRQALPGLHYRDDGALDANGRAVFIANLLPQPDPGGLNCSGFVKWITDGILSPITGTYLSIEILKDRMINWRGTSFTERFETTHDPFFGLDWSRALAREAWSVLYPAWQDPSPLLFDVGDPPFALIVQDVDPLNATSGGYRTFADNFDDAGIEVAGLKALLFMLATREPGRFYLAQFNARDDEPPRLRRFFHVAALVPYFDSAGIFRIDVFESAAETSIERLLASKRYEFVKLVRMPVSLPFAPPPFPGPR
jgi:hypothetical protein